MLLASIFLLADVAIDANPARLSDAFARSQGTDLQDARKIGNRIFARIEPVQVLKIRVDQLGEHRVASLILSGVKFHGTVGYGAFTEEVERLALDALAAAPIEEVDVEVIVPLGARQGVVVSGDGNTPTNRTVFTLTVRSGETLGALRARVDRADGVYWDPGFLQSLQKTS